MVRGLFPRAEHETLLEALELSIVFVTSDRLEAILWKPSLLSSAWDIANLYLASVGAELLVEHLSGPMPGDDRVDEEEYQAVVTEAVGARNGWRRILQRCAPRPPSRRT